MDKRIWYGIGGLVLLIGIIYGSLSIYSGHEAKVAKALKVKADIQAGVIAGLEEAAKKDKADIDDLHKKNSDKDDKIARLLKNRPAAPPPITPVPDTNEELSFGLVEKGLTPGLVVSTGAFSTLSTPDAKKVYTWASEAARVPVFEIKSTADDNLIKEQTEFAEGLKKESAKKDDLLGVKDKQLGAYGTEVGALRGANDALLKVQVATAGKTKIKIGITAALFGYAGYRIGRR